LENIEVSRSYTGVIPPNTISTFHKYSKNSEVNVDNKLNLRGNGKTKDFPFSHQFFKEGCFTRFLRPIHSPSSFSESVPPLATHPTVQDDAKSHPTFVKLPPIANESHQKSTTIQSREDESHQNSKRIKRLEPNKFGNRINTTVVPYITRKIPSNHLICTTLPSGPPQTYAAATQDAVTPTEVAAALPDAAKPRVVGGKMKNVSETDKGRIKIRKITGTVKRPSPNRKQALIYHF